MAGMLSLFFCLYLTPRPLQTGCNRGTVTCRALFTHPGFASLVDPPFAAHKEGENYSLT